MQYVVLGYGKFGELAVSRLVEAFPGATLVVVDWDPIRFDNPLPDGAVAFQDDATEFLVRSTFLSPEDLVLPMVPFHLAASYLKASVQGCREIPVPECLATMVPNPFSIDSANLGCSKADFLCPDCCPEGDLCTMTGLPREPLYGSLEALEVPQFTVVVQRSAQILPGVGGYTFGQLRALAGRMRHGSNLVATSCKCHAILTALEVT
ncbi:MAG: hypothetical protein AB1733_17740 [Thermodesulfobacteriota bacterium]